MHFYILFLATLVVGSYSQSISTDAFEKSLSRQRREFWNDVINEISDDINGYENCVAAEELFEAGGEVVAVAKRSIAEHILEKRGVIQFFKKWYNKLSPFQCFYNCYTFIKDKGTEIYNAIEHPEKVKKEFSDGYKETAQILRETFNGSLTNMIQSVDAVKTHLEQSEGNGNPDQKVLYKTITGVLSNLTSYAASLRKEDVEKVFLDTMKMFPRVGNSLSKLNWNSLSSLKLSSSPKTVRLFAGNMQHFDLAHNLLVIMNNASIFYPKFVAEEYPYEMDLALGASCINFLSNTIEIHQTANSLSNIGKLQYLELARKCGSFVTERTTDDQTSKEKSTILTKRFFKSIEQSEQFLVRIEYYLRIAEHPVEPLTGDKKMLADAVRKIRKYLRSSVTERTKQFLQEAFDDIVPALDKVEAMSSEWSLLEADEKNEVTPFAPGSYLYRLVDLSKQFSVSSNVKTADSFLKVMSFATQTPFLSTTWLLI